MSKIFTNIEVSVGCEKLSRDMFYNFRCCKYLDLFIFPLSNLDREKYIDVLVKGL